MKTCTSCNEQKPLTEFYTNTDKRDGRVYYKGACKCCNKKRARAWAKANPEKVKVSNSNAFKNHRDSRLQRLKKYREDHAEQIKNNRHRYYQKDNERYKRYKEELSAPYIIQLLCRRTPLTAEAFKNSPEIIELKRTQVHLIRILNEHNRNTRS